MRWSDQGFLLSKNIFSENSVIIEVFTLNHGKCSGIVYGGTSRKIKNYLQLGNKIYLDHKKKEENKLGYFKVEIIDPVSPYLFDDKIKLICLISSINVLRSLLPEQLIYRNIYLLFSEFLNDLKYNDNWIVKYIFWEINVLKEIGFDMNLISNLVINKNNKDEMVTVSIDNIKTSIPSFLIKKEFSNINNQSIYIALKFIGKFIERNILLPNNINYPKSRINLENCFL